MSLEEICEINIGKTPSRDKAEYWGAGSPWLSIADMNQGRVLSETKERITDRAIRECNCKEVPAGTVLMSFKLSLGKVGITSRPMYTNEAIAALPIRDGSKVHTGYLAWALQRLDFASGVGRAAMGLTLNKASLRQLRIPLPPLDEQRRIAAILDEADALRAKRRAAIAKLDELPQAIFYEMFGDPVTNPMGWPVLPLEKVTVRESGLKRGPFGGAITKAMFVEQGFKVYEQQHAIKGDWQLGHYFINDMKYKELISFSIRSGDFIVSCSGTTGRIYRMPDDAQPGIINQALLRIRVDKQLIEPTFFETWFKFPSVQYRITGSSRGSGINNFPPMQEIRGIPVIDPPRDKQAELERRIAEVTCIRDVVERSQVRLETLFRALEDHAFRGGL